MSLENNAAPGVNGEPTGGEAGERLRIKALQNLARQHKVDEKTVDGWVDGGISVDDACRQVLDIIAERGATKPQSPAALGLSAKEARNFSLIRAVNAVVDKNWTKAGFEAECSREIMQRMGKQPSDNSFFIPLEVQKRDLTVATANAGGYLVETANQGFIDLLRNRSVLFAMGARRLSGLQGNISVPKQTAAATAYWLANEATAITESQQTLGQLVLSPKNVGAYTEISRQLTLQSSPEAEGMVMDDLAKVVALAVDSAGINGSGASGQPTGVISTAGIGSVTGTSIAYAGIVEFQTDVAASNALAPSCGYVTTPAVAGLLKQRVKFSSTASPMWEGTLLDGNVDGYRAMASNQMPSANLLFGDFQQIIVAEWGVLEVAVNPYAAFATGIIGIRAFYTCDIGVRYASAFSLATSVT